MKKRIACIAAAAISATALFSGCFVTQGADGRDGKDGQNASVYDYYEMAKSVHGEDYSIEEFLHDYLNYTSEEVENAINYQASINRSLMSAVSIAASFNIRGSYGQAGTTTALGSGVIVDLDKEAGDAYILTNAHVVYNDSSSELYSQNVYCYLYGQDGDFYDEDSRFSASVIGASITYDVALLKVTGSDLIKNSSAIAAQFSADDDIYLGEKVYTVGNAEGCGLSATSGIITKDREVIALNLSDRYANSESYYRCYTVLRTDAAVNEGNSGGALFNGRGEIVALINSKSGDEEDEYGFIIDDIDAMNNAIPVSIVRRLYLLMRDGYEKNGFDSHNAKLDRAHFVVMEDFTYLEQTSPATSAKIEVKAVSCATSWDNENLRAVINEKVVMQQDANGLKQGDVIKHVKITDNGGNVIENRPVSRLYHLQDALLSAREGYGIVITVFRGGNSTDVDVTSQMNFYEFD